MASILQFIPRQASSSNWSDDERARLYEFASAMAESCGVRIDFGRTDEGDPWCVVLDDNEDVLVHVARIDGMFVAHAVAEDLVAQASELSAALDRALGTRSGDRADVVVPFPSNRSSQIVTAVLVAAAITWSGEAEAHEPLAMPSLADGGSDTPRDRRDAITIVLPVDLLPDLSRISPPGAPDSPSPAYDLPLFATLGIATHEAGAPSSRQLQTEGGPVPLDGKAATSLPDEPPHVVLQAASPPTPQPTAELPFPAPAVFIVGTGDDDSLLVGGSAVASGGAGADQFIIAPPPIRDGQPLGIILDFSISEGDSLQIMPIEGRREGFTEPPPQAHRFDVAAAEVAPSIMSVHAIADIRPDATVGQLPIGGVRLGVDLDADGREDGFVLLGGVDEANAARLFGVSPDHPAPFSGHDAAPAAVLPLHPDPLVATTLIG